MAIKTINDLGNIAGKKIICRVDLNVPMRHGRVTDKTRIVRLIPTIKELIKKQAKVIVISHFGRPDGTFNRDMSLAPLADELGNALGVSVKFAVDCIGESAQSAINLMNNGEVILLENLRFHAGEETNNSHFSDELAKLGDIYVNDTFSCSHRKHASIVGIAERLPSAAGLLLKEEIDHLEKILVSPDRPVAAIVGGSKVSTKLKILNSLITKVDMLVIGGAMANTFLKAKGIKIGNSLYEKDLVDTAKDIIARAEKKNCEIFLPTDAIIAKELTENPECMSVDIKHIPSEYMILDLGSETMANLTTKLQSYKTIIWNGPVGAFEFRPFDVSSITLARIIAKLTKEQNVTSVAGGGDVVAALAASGLTESFSYVSTAGGAFLDWLGGDELPGIIALSK